MLVTSVAERAAAHGLARRLVEGRWAGCVQILPIDSVYRWEDAVETANEWLLLAKIRRCDFAEAEAAIRATHAYDVPEIVALPFVAGTADYIAWLAATTAR